MATAFHEDRDWDTAAGRSLVEAITQRAGSFASHGAAMHEHRAALYSWTGLGGEAAAAVIEQSQESPPTRAARQRCSLRPSPES